MEFTQLDEPIDIMFLIHKSLSAEAGRVQGMIEGFNEGDSLQAIRLAFGSWAALLMYHADIEDRFMTAPLTESKLARTNEAEHQDLARLGEDFIEFLAGRETPDLKSRLKSAVLALHEQQHDELLRRLEDVLEVIDSEIGRQRVIARTRRHLLGRVVALRICQDDHFESEEALVLPEVREHFDKAGQLDIAHRLLMDDEGDNPKWVFDSIVGDLTDTEQKLLSDLELARVA